MEGLERVRSGLELVAHGVINSMATAISAEMLRTAGLQLPPPTGRKQAGHEISLLMTCEPPDGVDRSKVDEVMKKAGNAAEMMDLLRRVGLG